MSMDLRLRRHDLVSLSSVGWRLLLDSTQDAVVRDCLAHWCEKRFPLVVGRQDRGGEYLALGLAAPIAWGRRKIALRVSRTTVLCHRAFPPAQDVMRLLPAALRPQWMALVRSLSECGVQARVHGSFGWQRTTGLRYLVSDSDIDLLLPVASAVVADTVGRFLESFRWSGPRVDGEVIFPGGSATAWREWLLWRRGAVAQIMVKRLEGVSLERGLSWFEDRRFASA